MANNQRFYFCLCLRPGNSFFTNIYPNQGPAARELWSGVPGRWWGRGEGGGGARLLPPRHLCVAAVNNLVQVQQQVPYIYLQKRKKILLTFLLRRNHNITQTVTEKRYRHKKGENKRNFWHNYIVPLSLKPS